MRLILISLKTIVLLFQLSTTAYMHVRCVGILVIGVQKKQGKKLLKVCECLKMLQSVLFRNVMHATMKKILEASSSMNITSCTSHSQKIK